MLFTADINLSDWFFKKNSSIDGYEDEIFLCLCKKYGRNTKEFFSPTLKNLPNPNLMHNIEEGAQFFLDAFLENKKILIIGDYDVDGISAVCLMIRFFGYLKYDNFDTLIPNRFTHGYGITNNLLPTILGKEPDVIITVDNGITAGEEIAYLQQQGKKILVTDHHQLKVGYTPDCLIINPCQDQCQYPFPFLSGTGVAFMLLIEIRKQLRQKKFWDNISEPNLSSDLDLLCISTIADQLYLREVNRNLSFFGLNIIQNNLHAATQPKYSYIQAFSHLFSTTLITTEKLNYSLIPLLNASGRMNSAEKSLAFLASQSVNEALGHIKTIRKTNEERKKKQHATYNSIMKNEAQLAHKNGIFLWSEEFHEGVVGIVAAQIANETGKPVALAIKKGEELKGSCRSLNGINILSVLEKCQQCLTRYGGHKEAAGFQLKHKNQQQFLELFDNACASFSPTIEHKIVADIELETWMVSPVLYHKISTLEPFGNGNPAPQFIIRNLKISPPYVIGNKHLKWKYSDSIELIFWNGSEKKPQGNIWDIIFTLTQTTYNNKDILQMVIKNATSSNLQ